MLHPAGYLYEGIYFTQCFKATKVKVVAFMILFYPLRGLHIVSQTSFVRMISYSHKKNYIVSAADNPR